MPGSTTARTMLTTGEREYLKKLGSKLESLRAVLNERPPPTPASDPRSWFAYASEVKVVLGNFDNDVSFVACLMAKGFLLSHHRLPDFDVSSKPQSAPGLDIELVNEDGERIVGEIKTTIPYRPVDLGAQQKASFKKDFEKLAAEGALHKYFFVTDIRTFEVVRKRYMNQLKGVTVVLLPQGLADDAFVIRGGAP